VSTEENGFWSVIITPNSGRKGRSSDDAVAVDKDRDWIETRILSPRRLGQPVAVDGHTLEWSEIDRIRITVSDVPSGQVIERLKAQDRASSVAMFGGPSYKWRAAAAGKDMTDSLIDGPPGTEAVAPASSAKPRLKAGDRSRVMVVHGRDSQARRALFDFLRALGLKPGEWRALIAETEKASPYIGEVLDLAFERAAAVVVLLTPDDEAKLRDEFVEDGDSDEEKKLTPQPRPNVLFEAGMAFGLHPDRTVLVELGTVRQFSDVAGRHIVRLNGTPGPLRDIAGRLKAAGCAVDDSGDDWADPHRFPAR
jgi:predicted nucleotide-binding protein